MKKIILFFIIIFFIGCSSNPTPNQNNTHQDSIQKQKALANKAWNELDNPQKKNFKIEQNLNKQVQIHKQKPIITNISTSSTIPNWFYNPPKNNNYFYGVGEGKTKIESKNKALNYIASQIQTTISSNFSQTQGFDTTSKNSYSFAKLNINSQVNKINFPNIEIVKIVKFGGEIWTLVRINKQIFLKYTEKKLNLLYLEIKTVLQKNQNLSLYSQLLFYNKLSKKITKMIQKLNTIIAINPNFNGNKFIKLQTYFNTLKQNLLHKISFNVTNHNLFGNAIISILNNNGYKVSNNSTIYIKLIQNITYSKPFGIYIAKVDTNINFIVNNQIIHSFNIQSKGIANSKNQSLFQAANNFKRQLNKIKINKLLGF